MQFQSVFQLRPEEPRRLSREIVSIIHAENPQNHVGAVLHAQGPVKSSQCVFGLCIMCVCVCRRPMYYTYAIIGPIISVCHTKRTSIGSTTPPQHPFQANNRALRCGIMFAFYSASYLSKIIYWLFSGARSTHMHAHTHIYPPTYPCSTWNLNMVYGMRYRKPSSIISQAQTPCFCCQSRA